MKDNIPLESLINHLLDILKVAPGDLPERAQNSWQSLFGLAMEEKVYLYIAKWFLEWGSKVIHGNISSELEMSLTVNKARNALLMLHIEKLACLFKNTDIPLMFLKGAAGLIRGLYNLDTRFLSDLDVLVPSQYIEKTHYLLLSEGYLCNENLAALRHYHHLIYSHPRTCW